MGKAGLTRTKMGVRRDHAKSKCPLSGIGRFSDLQLGYTALTNMLLSGGAKDVTGFGGPDRIAIYQEKCFSVNGI